MQIDSTRWQSPNHSPRTYAIDSIVIHTTEGLYPGTAAWLVNPASKVSCHYLILRDGRIFQLVNLSRVAWHAGVCRYWTGRWWRWDWNAQSIGIELEHVRGQDYPRAQLDALVELGRSLVKQYSIKSHMIVAHRWIATPRGRKIDPTDMSDAELGALIKALYRDPLPDEVRTYRVTIKAFPRAIVREHADRASRDTGKRLAVGATFRGVLTTHGVPYKNDARWVERIPEQGGGFVWYGLVELVPS